MQFAAPLLIFATVAGIGLGIGISHRLGKIQVLNSFYFSLVMIALTTTAVMCAALAFDHIVAQVSHPKYEATIVNYESRWEEDDDGDMIEMHRPILQFIDNREEQITVPSNTSSSWRPTIGDTRSIRFQDGKLHEPSLVLYLVLGLFISVTGYLIALATAFVFGRSTAGLTTLGVNTLLYVLVPAGLGGMGLAMLWSVYEFGFGRNRPELTLGSAVLVGLFGLIILLALAGYILNLVRAARDKQK